MKLWTQFVESEVSPQGPRMSKTFEAPCDPEEAGIVSVEIRSTGYVVIWVVPDDCEPSP